MSHSLSFSSPDSHLDHLTSGQDDNEPQDVVLCRTIFDGPDAAGIVSDHSADGCGGSGIRRKEESIAAQLFVEFLVYNPRLDIDLEILDGRGTLCICWKSMTCRGSQDQFPSRLVPTPHPVIGIFRSKA
jgi:hypothetical protein